MQHKLKALFKNNLCDFSEYFLSVIVTAWEAQTYDFSGAEAIGHDKTFSVIELYPHGCSTPQKDQAGTYCCTCFSNFLLKLAVFNTFILAAISLINSGIQKWMIKGNSLCLERNGFSWKRTKGGRCKSEQLKSTVK